MKRTKPPLLPPGIHDAVSHARLDELERLLAGHALLSEQLVSLALTTRDEATRRRLLADCRESASFHRGALAVARDDEAAIREAHARGVDWHAPLGPPYEDSAVQMAAALGHVAGLRALIALDVDIDRLAHRTFGHRTPLVIAMGRGRWDAARMLLARSVAVERPDLVRYLPDAPRDVLAALLARGLRWEYVQAQAGLMAERLTPETLRTLVELGMRVDERALAWIVSSRRHVHAPDEAHVALVRELLRLCPPPAKGKVKDPGGETIDLLADAVELLPLQVAKDLVAAGVVMRKVSVPSGAPDEVAKKAWLGLPTPPAAGEPALPITDFFRLNDGDITEHAITAQLALAEDGRLAFGPVQLGMKISDLRATAPGKWFDHGKYLPEPRRRSNIGDREHSVLIQSLADGSVFHVMYVLMYNTRTIGPLPGPVRWQSDASPPQILPHLTALLGKPTRKRVIGATWLHGDTRVTIAWGDLTRHVRFTKELLIELLDERHRDQAVSHEKLQKLAP